MTKVLVATVKPFAPAAVNGIREVVEGAGYEMALLEKYANQQDFIDAAADADAVIIRSDKADADVFASAKNMKIIVRAGAGYDNVDLEAASVKDIVVMNTPGQNSNAVAELALGMMVYMARKQFNGTSGSELKGKKLGIHAYGHVGRLVANIAKGFGMDCYAFDPFITKEDIEKDGVTALDTVADRSIMNICFVMEGAYEKLEQEFFEFASSRGMVGIKGHRSVGGFRASTYNALPVESVEALVGVMQEFENSHK